eukprot:TRINITY_DN8069_c0_g1_i1.p1 TRINITY_DN8069_c0_g1~~TRINITY_DN8069_c0_g1_i1.p1  ORF type:complete len:453 (+),score=103.04 TRINITY_DN8069_c0_g1_i1:51-1409(+)
MDSNQIINHNKSSKDEKLKFVMAAIKDNDLERLRSNRAGEWLKDDYFEMKGLLNWAVNVGPSDDTRMLSFLLQHLKPNSRSGLTGPTALQTACMYGKEEMVKVLLAHSQIDPNVADNNGVTPLHCACFYGSVGCVKMLLRHPKVNTFLKNKHGKVPKRVAAAQGHQEIFELIDEKENLPELEARRKACTKLVQQRGVENCNRSELALLLQNEGIANSTIISLEDNNIRGDLLFSLNSDIMKHDLNIQLMERLKLKRALDCWKQRVMVKRNFQHNSNDQVVAYFGQFEFISLAFLQNIRKLQIDGWMLEELEDTDLRELGIKSFLDRRKLLTLIGNSDMEVQPVEKSELITTVASPTEEYYILRQSEMTEELERLQEKMKEVPEPFLCPITHEIMSDPVVASDGHTYEKDAIKEWFGRGNATSPLTGKKLDDLKLIPSHTMKMLIQDFMEKNK